MGKWILIGIAGLVLIGWIANSNDSSSSGDQDEPTYSVPITSKNMDELLPSSSSSSSDGVRILASGSVCDQAAGEARIYVYFTLRNTTGEQKSVDVMARRRYSDGTSNDSIIDTMTAEIGPHQTQRYHGGPFDYNAQKHILIECYLHFAGDVNEVEVRVD